MYVQLGRVEDALALLESEHYEHYHVSMDTTEECTNEMEQSQIVKLPEQTDHTLEVGGGQGLVIRFCGRMSAVSFVSCQSKGASSPTHPPSSSSLPPSPPPPPPPPPPQGLRVLLHRYTVLVNSGRVSEYVHDGTALLAVLFRDVYHRRDLRC